MRSIRAEVTRLAVIVILVSMTLAGGVSVLSLRSQGTSNAERLMGMVCESNFEQINARLEDIENIVNMTASYVDASLSVTELARGGVIGATGSGISLRDRQTTDAGQQALDDYLTSNVNEVESVFFSGATQLEGVLGFYYRINPEISHEVRGFLRSRIDGGGFMPREPTHLEDHASNDYAKVGWFYLPQERGRPVWLDPYMDENQGIEVISFVAPLYKAGTFIGVVGVDIPLSWLTERVMDLEVPSSGYAFLTDNHSKIISHPTLARQVSIGEIQHALDGAGRQSGISSTAGYTFEGVEKKAVWETLNNGMRLVVCAPVFQMNVGWYELVGLMLVAAVAIAVIFVAVVTMQMKRITEPLEDLTTAAMQIAGGNYDVSLAYKGEDEVGILTNAFRLLVERVKVRISDLNRRVFTDALTHVRNKGAYDVYAGELNERLEAGEQVPFAIVAFDCNELKRVNDTYGHEKGDLYLRNACQLICRIYDHSPVFRVGGDEFCAVLTGDDYEKRELLADQFKRHETRLALAARHDWERVSVAMGMAAYDAQRDESVEAVARRADGLMYANKSAEKDAAHRVR